MDEWLNEWNWFALKNIDKCKNEWMDDWVIGMSLYSLETKNVSSIWFTCE